MQVSELVSQPQALIRDRGDLPVMDEYGREVDSPEYNDDDGDCILLAFYES